MIGISSFIGDFWQPWLIWDISLCQLNHIPLGYWDWQQPHRPCRKSVVGADLMVYLSRSLLKNRGGCWASGASLVARWKAKDGKPKFKKSNSFPRKNASEPENPGRLLELQAFVEDFPWTFWLWLWLFFAEVVDFGVIEKLPKLWAVSGRQFHGLRRGVVGSWSHSRSVWCFSIGINGCINDDKWMFDGFLDCWILPFFAWKGILWVDCRADYLCICPADIWAVFMSILGSTQVQCFAAVGDPSEDAYLGGAARHF